MDQRHELPSLKNVQHNADPGVLGVLIASLALASICVLGFILYFMITDPISSPHLGLNVDTLLPTGVAVFILILLAILRSPTFHYKWETSSNGLRFEGFACGGLIRWNEVVSAETRWVNILVGRRIVIRTRHEATHLPVRNPALSASVWQHLHQAGKSEGIELDPVAESLWAEPFDSVPETIEWKHPKPIRFRRVVAGAVLFYALYFFLEWKLSSNNFAGWILAIPVGLMAESSLRGALFANHLSTDEQGLTVRAMLRTVTARWDEIKSAGWNEGWRPRVEIQLSWWNRVYVPYLEDDEHSRQAILSLTRDLRNRSHLPVHLPADMLPEEE